MKRYLFVCVENSCRSQMAEAFARREGVDAQSAGSRPSGVVNPRAIEFMHEIGYDLSTHCSVSFTDVDVAEFEAIVTMGCGDACRHLPARNRIDWAIPDPKNMGPDEFRRVRDTIRDNVRALLAP